MEFSFDLKKLAFFLLIIFPHVSAVTHSLQYRYTALIPGMDLIDVDQLDGTQFVYYDTNVRKKTLNPEWIKQLSADDPDYWAKQTQRMQRDEEDLKQLLDTVLKVFNHSEGIYTLQRLYGCDLDDDGTTRGYDQISYNGEVFIRLDLKTGTWTAVNAKFVITKEKWESTGADANVQKHYLETECIEDLKKCVSNSTQTIKRKDGGSDGVKASVSIGVIVGVIIGLIIGVIILLIAAVAGLFICNRWRRGREGYAAQTDILELV